MSAFDDEFATAFPELIDTFGEDVVYTEQGGLPVTVKGISGEMEVTTQDGNEGETTLRVETVMLPRTSTAAGGGNYVAEPRMNATITMDGRSYAIDRVVSQTATATCLQLARRAVSGQQKPGLEAAR